MVTARSGMRIAISEERCCGSGMCVFTAPTIFDQREEDGVVLALVSTPSSDQYGAVRAAVAGCPTSAIRLIGGAINS